MKNRFPIMGLAVGLLVSGLAISTAIAASDTEVVTVGISIPTPDVDIDVPLSFGTDPAAYFAFAKTGTQASQTIDPAAVVNLTSVPGALGSARLVPLDTTGASAMHVTFGGVTPGYADAAMTVKVEDSTTSAATVTLVGAVPDNTFTITTWTAADDTTVYNGAISGFSSSTGIGTLTLDVNGQAALYFGAKLNTVSSATPYNTQTYTGGIRVNLNY